MAQRKGAKNCPSEADGARTDALGETVRFEREQRGFSLHALNGVSRAAAAGEADAMRRRRRRARTAHKRWVYAKAFARSLALLTFLDATPEVAGREVRGRTSFSFSPSMYSFWLRT